MELTTLLFDLDGTLLPLDIDVFMRGYFGKLIPHVAPYIHQSQIVDKIWAATEDMIRNEDAGLTNLEAFKRSFFSTTDVPESVIWPVFDAFYGESFSQLKEFTEPTSISREICRTAHDKGYRLVLATNPIFPEQAILHRMEWAGINDVPFSLVTTMEIMHYCKPNPKYYVEILDKIDASPAECIMIGNDVQEDGVAGKLGMQTFLVNDCKIDRGLGHLEFTHEGTLVDVLTWVEGLPSLQR